jgi:hypothetical protein
LSQQRGYGGHGHHQGANSSYGWLALTAAGQRTDLPTWG